MQLYAANKHLYHLGDCPYYNTGPNTGPSLGDPKRDHKFDNSPSEELQAALDVAFALRSTLEAAGHTHEEIVDGADQVTNALIAQWVAEDSQHARNPEEEVDVDNKEEEECQEDEEASTLA